MDLLIESLIRLQQSILTKEAVNAFNTLKTMPLENLRVKLEEAEKNKNTAFVSTIGHILDYGTINSDLNDREKSILENTITSRSDLETIKKILELFAELRRKIEPALKDHTLIEERLCIENMHSLAEVQDELLIDVAESYPKSSLWLPSDIEKGRLISLYCEIKSLKAVDYMLFTDTVMPDILRAASMNYMGLCIDCLSSYLDGKNTTLSNLDEEIKNIHIKAQSSMTKAPENQRSAYLEISKSLESAQEEYLSLQRINTKYKNPKNRNA